MAKEQKSFIKGRMNKSVDERLLPEGEYIDALNIRLGSTELSEVGAVENSKGNVKLTELKYNGVALSGDAVCIGAFDDSAEETMYWFVHDPNHSYGGVVDMIVSFNVSNNQLVYHVVTTALLNFNPTHLVNGINKIDDLLFFTDDYNQPRKINVTRGYAQPDPITNVDQIVELDISVIKPQPTGAPVIELQNSSEDSNHIRDTFISFAYRYKYRDGEYSALSQFSDIAFSTDVFYIKDSNMVNDGMTNQYNSVKVSFNTGPENVVGIDVVYKESDSNFIYVAKKIDKGLYSLPSNFTETITFSNNEIYTILSEPELLRLYDNVPRLAKAQTIMGNRLMYGNYLEGRDVIDDTGAKVNFNYEPELVAKAGVLESIDYYHTDTTSYTYNLIGIPVTKQGGSLIMETSGKPVDYYSSEVTMSITMVFESLGVFYYDGTALTTVNFTNFTPVNTSEGEKFILNFNYTPNQDYQTAYQAYNTADFKDKTGENGYEELPSNWENDSTLTGRFNFLSPKPYSLDTSIFPDFNALRSARDSSISDFIKFEVLPNGNIQLTPNAIQLENIGDPNFYVFYKINRASVSWSREIGQRSLHSNRDYQVGIVYEDNEGRYSPVFESGSNSVFIPASKSDDINSIKVTIPSSMKAPAWANRYKFVLKQNKTDYETIFSTKSYIDEDTGRYWVLLDGEQGNKVSVGQELIVKKDGSGPTVNEVITTVLDVKSLATGDLYGTLQGAPVGSFSPSGVYASLSPDGWNIEQGFFTTLTSGQYVSGQDSNSIFSGYLSNDYPVDIAYPVHDDNGDDWRINTGDVVNISFSFVRRGSGNSCGDEICFFIERYISSGEYANLRDFWIQEPVDLSAIDCSETNDISGANQTIFQQNEIVLDPLIPVTNTNIDGVNQIVFGRTSGTNRLHLVLISGSKNFPWNMR